MLPSVPVRTLAFSKDGKWIAYTSLADNDLWRCRSDGKECLQLTKGFKQTVMPRWSPDGRTVAFMGLHFSGGWGIFAVPANGGEIRSLSNVSQAQGDPDWSPDGQRLVFGDVRPVSDPGGIYVLDLGTNKMSKLPESAGYFSPRWSPDGRFLVALHEGDQYLYLFEFGPAKWRRLAEVPSGYPSWSQDGKHVYFLSSAAGDRAVFRVAVGDRTVEKVASLAGVEHGPFFMSDWIGLAPDDTPLAIHDLTTEDIYAWDLIAR
jgi:Tol biopolymer transport system component